MSAAGRAGAARPGHRGNAALATAAADVLGIAPADALAAMRAVTGVGGRYAVHRRPEATYRLFLAKNPAGWVEIFDMLAEADRPLVLAINARTADGRDTSWLWDVPFEAPRAARRRDRRAGCRPGAATGVRRGGPRAGAGHRCGLAHRQEAARPAPGGQRPRPRCGGQLHGLPGAARDGGTSERAPVSDSSVAIALLYPELLGTYGDGGNATVLAQRLRWRGIAAEVVTVPPRAPLPTCEIYLLGGDDDPAAPRCPRTGGRPADRRGGGRRGRPGRVRRAAGLGGPSLPGRAGTPKGLACSISRRVGRPGTSNTSVQWGRRWSSHDGACTCPCWWGSRTTAASPGCAGTRCPWAPCGSASATAPRTGPRA